MVLTLRETVKDVFILDSQLIEKSYVVLQNGFLENYFYMHFSVQMLGFFLVVYKILVQNFS